MLIAIGVGRMVFGASFEEVQSSAQGLLIEETFDPSTWFLFSVSTLDDDQREAYHALVTRFSDDPTALRDLLVQGIDENLASIDLSYLEDIEPMIGDNGTRFVFGLAEDGDQQIVVQAGLTLEDPAAAQSLLTTLEAEGRFVKKNRDGFDLYYNVYSEQESESNPEVVVYHFGLYEDLFLVASSEDALMNLLNRARSEGDESLWTDPTYQEVVAEMPARHVGWVYIDTQTLQTRQEEALTGDVSSLASAASTSDYLAAQGFALIAEEDRIRFEGFGVGDRERLEADDTTLDRLHAKNRYLFKDMPADKAMAYFESYNLAFGFSDAVGGESSGTLTAATQMLGIPTEDLAAFMEEGYALSVNRNAGFLPGLTFMVDVSDASLTAQGVLDAVDAQLTSLIGIFKFQGGAIAEALTKETQTIAGGDFNVIRLDVDSVLSLYESYGESFVLPATLQGLEVVLLYGRTADDRLVVSNFEGWLTESFPTLTHDADFEAVTDDLNGYKEGVFFLDFDEITRYLIDFKDFREALSADATSMAELFDDPAAASEIVPGEVVRVEGDTVVSEAEMADLTAVETTTVEEVLVEEDSIEVVSEGPVPAGMASDVAATTETVFEDWLEFLEPLKSFGFSSAVDKYEIRLQGVLIFDAAEEE